MESSHIKLPINSIIQGDALSVLKTLPSESVNCVVTSPPYWALRDYGVKGQLGLEPTFEEYINKLCDIFDEVKRVLRKDGTCWVNMGDTYGGPTGEPNAPKLNKQQVKEHKSASRVKATLQAKCLVQIPSRFAIEMTDRGWVLRNEIIWEKPNCMPSSATDRFTVDFEKMFFFTKSKKYWFDQQFDRYSEVFLNDSRIEKIKNQEKLEHNEWKDYKNTGAQNPCSVRDRILKNVGLNGRNKRCVWRITTKGYKEAHFATYPEKLIETPILAGCPEKVCKKCGKPRERITRSHTIYRSGSGKSSKKPKGKYLEKEGHGIIGKDLRMGPTSHHQTIGWTDCKCNAGFESGIVLDPFMGAGTTALVALKQGKKFVGIELNKSYIEIAQKRIEPLLRQGNLF